MMWFLIIVVALAILASVLWFLQRFYAKATLDYALIRTGFGGRCIILAGGCLALPILHQVQRATMGVVTFAVERKGREALLTDDRLRADVDMEVEFRVTPTEAGVALAVQSLGTRIARGGSGIAEALSGSLVDAMQKAAAERTLDQIHHDRAGFTATIAESAAMAGERLGLTLVSLSLLHVDQSDHRQLDENNSFNAQGMRRLAELIAEQRKQRVRIEAEADIAVRESRLAQHQRQLDIGRAQNEADIAQREYLVRLEAEARALSEQKKAAAEKNAETAAIDKEQHVKTAAIMRDEALRRAEMAAILNVEETKIAHAMQLSHKRADEAEAKAIEEAARAQVLLAAEGVQLQKDRAVAAREHEVAEMNQNKELDLETERTKRQAETLLTRVNAEVSAIKAQAEGEKTRREAEAAGDAALIAAENARSDKIIAMRLEERKLDRLPEIMTQMMKPVEKIDSIRINQIGGLRSDSSSEGGVDSAFGAAMEQILGMAVRLPAMKQMGAEIGLDFDAHLAGRAADSANRIKKKDDEN